MADPTPRRGRRWRRVLLGLVVLVAAIGLAHRPLIDRPLAHLVAHVLAGAVGGEATVGTLRGNLLRDVELTDVQLRADAGPVVTLRIAHLHVRYGLWSLLRGHGVDALHAVEADGVDADLDVLRPSRPRPRRPSGPGNRTLPASLPQVRIAGHLAIRLPGPGGATRLRTDVAVRGGDTGPVVLTFHDLNAPGYGVASPSWTAVIDPPAAGVVVLHATTPLAGILVRRIVLRTAPSMAVEARLGMGAGGIDAAWTPTAVTVHLMALDTRACPEVMRALLPMGVHARLDGGVQLGLRPWSVTGAVELRDVEAAGLHADDIAVAGSASATMSTLTTLRITGAPVGLTIEGGAVDLVHRQVGRLPQVVALDVADVRPLLAWARVHVTAAVPALPFDGPLGVHLRATGDGRTLHIASARWEGGGSVAAQGTLTLPQGSDWRAVGVQLQAAVDLQAGILLHGTAGHVHGTLACRGLLGDPVWQAHLHADGVRVHDQTLGTITVDGDGGAGVVTLTRLALVGPGRLDVHGSWDLHARRCRMAQARLQGIDLGTIAAVAGIAGAGGHVDGVIALTQATLPRTLDLGPLLRAIDGHATLAIADARWHDRPWGSLHLALAADAGRWTLSQVTLDPGHEGPLRADVAGAVILAPDRLAVSLARLALIPTAEPALAVILGAPAHLTWQRDGHWGRWTLDQLAMTCLGGRIDGHVTLTDHAVEGRLALLRLRPWDLARARLGSTAGWVDARLRFSGTPADPHLSIAIDTVGVRLGGRGAVAVLHAEVDREGLLVPAVRVHIDRCLDVHGSGVLPLEGASHLQGIHPTAADAQLFVRAAAAPDLLPASTTWPVTGLLDAAVTIDAQGLRMRAAVRELLLRLPASVDPRQGSLRVASRIDTQLEANAQGWQATIAVAAGEDIRLHAQADGALPLSPIAPLEFVRAFRTAPAHLAFAIERMDLSRLQTFLPQLVRITGQITGSLTASGTPAAPHWDGRLRLTGVAGKTRSALPPFTDGSGTIAIHDHLLRIESLQARLGYAPVSVQGTIDAARATPVVDLQLTGSNALVVQSEYLRLRLDAALHATGALDALRCSGAVTVTDALYSQPFDLLSHLRPSSTREPPSQHVDQGIPLFSIRNGPLAGVIFDVHVHAVQSIHIATDLAAGACSCELHLGGTGIAPIVTGRVWVDDAKLDLPFSRLTLTHAQLTFGADDPYAPRLQANGETRLRGYDLSVRIEGRLPDVVVTVDADPPLSASDGILLLTTGMTTQDREEGSANRTQLTMVGEYLAKEIWGQVGPASNPDAKDGLFDLDRLNLSVGEQITINGENTIDAEYRLTSWLYLHGERDIFDQYNLLVVWRMRAR